MKPSSYNKISTIVLWVCMLVTIAVSACFFAGYAKEDNNGASAGTSALIYWMCIVLILTLTALLVGVLWDYFKNKR